MGSLGIPVIDTQILGWERAYARSHPKIWPPVTAKSGEPLILTIQAIMHESVEVDLLFLQDTGSN